MQCARMMQARTGGNTSQQLTAYYDVQTGHLFGHLMYRYAPTLKFLVQSITLFLSIEQHNAPRDVYYATKKYRR